MRKEIIRTSQGEIAFSTQSATKEELRLLGLLMVPRSTDEIYNLLGEECEPLINSLVRRGWVKYNEKDKKNNQTQVESENPLERLRKKMELANLNRTENNDEVLEIDLKDNHLTSFSKEGVDIPTTIVNASHETGVAVKNVKRPHASKDQIEKSIDEFFDLFNIPPPQND